VIANGDVHDAASAVETLAPHRCRRRHGGARLPDAPWVFREIAAALAGEPVPESPSYLAQRALLLRHHAEMVEREGERWGTVAMRKFAVAT
jgi:tRNA-dihydrouridine synthase